MLFKVGDTFTTPANGTIYMIESINGNNVVLMWKKDGRIERTHEGSYDVDFVDTCFRDGSWKNIRRIRKEKLEKLRKI